MEPTVGPLIDRVCGVPGGVGVRVFPIEIDGVFSVNEHHVRDRSLSPREAPYTGVSVEIEPALLERPFLVAGSPAKLLKRRCIGGVPHMHADFVVGSCGSCRRD